MDVQGYFIFIGVHAAETSFRNEGFQVLPALDGIRMTIEKDEVLRRHIIGKNTPPHNASSPLTYHREPFLPH
ncbi:hypothetical protein PsorP6_013512 [Peronosclerospora sorghi]|uniref:Uncharacterized protein n=1 Tax=Peronosclerospora sorghi TaxID=230839 RepID=A0ACC0VHF3_9STRA|nr:hypothetical protein PsorP6_013512 [Peronosclerospora sorghi]